MLSYCLKCAAQNRSCCQHVHVYITQHDIDRINQWGETGCFSTLMSLSGDYADDSDDPGWNRLTTNQSGQRRVICQQSNGDCYFLTPVGCRLPSAIRPLLCRIYPYSFRAGQLCGISLDCPVSLQPDWQQLLELTEMKRENAIQWLAQLYQEIYDQNRMLPV